MANEAMLSSREQKIHVYAAAERLGGMNQSLERRCVELRVDK